MSTIKIYAPLLLVELYLLLGLWLFFFGPIIWPKNNNTEFLELILYYHLMFIGGYIIQSKIFLRKNVSKPTADGNSSEIFVRYFWIIVILAFAANVVVHRNTTLSNSYIPDDFFSGLYRGLVVPWEARAFYASANSMVGFVKNPYVTATLIIAGPFKYILLPCLVFYWHSLSLIRKAVGIFVITIPLLTGIIASLSVINFSYLFITSICLGILIASGKSKGVIDTLRQRKFFLAFLICIFLFSFWQFYSVKSGQSLYQVTIEKNEPQPTIDFLKQKQITFKSEQSHTGRSVAVDFYEKLTSYMVQGYNGMSLALGEDFESSFGIGHSVFLQKIFAEHFALDIRNRTYQHKITEQWDEFAYWHSFYSYIANDVSFWGVGIVMLVLGAYFSKTYLSAIIDDNFYAKMLLPLLGILFLYIPANNQIFGFLETMTSFWLLTILFITSQSRKIGKLPNLRA